MDNKQIDLQQLSFSQKTVLELVQRNFQAEVTIFDALDRKAQSVLAISSIIITIITGFQLASNSATPQGQLIIMLVIYGLTVMAALAALVPQEISHEPIKPSWHEMKKASNTPTQEFYDKILVDYEMSILRNRDVNASKARRVKLAFIALAFSVGFALFLVITTVP